MNAVKDTWQSKYSGCELVSTCLARLLELVSYGVLRGVNTTWEVGDILLMNTGLGLPVAILLAEMLRMRSV